VSFERAAALVFHLLGICAALVYLSERF